MRFLLILTISSLFIGCSKTTVVLLDSGKVGSSITVATQKATTKVDKVGSFVELKDKDETPSEVKEMSKEEINKRFGNVLKAAPTKPASYLLYFESGSTLTQESKKMLEEALKTIKKRSPCIVDIIGHTDTTGSSSLNQKVSLKRAKYIKSIIEKKDIKVIALNAKGYGEEDLQVKTPDNTANAKNRNVEIFIK